MSLPPEPLQWLTSSPRWTVREFRTEEAMEGVTGYRHAGGDLYSGKLTELQIRACFVYVFILFDFGQNACTVHTYFLTF